MHTCNHFRCNKFYSTVSRAPLPWHQKTIKVHRSVTRWTKQKNQSPFFVPPSKSRDCLMQLHSAVQSPQMFQTEIVDNDDHTVHNLIWESPRRVGWGNSQEVSAFQLSAFIIQLSVCGVCVYVVSCTSGRCVVSVMMPSGSGNRPLKLLLCSTSTMVDRFT